MSNISVVTYCDPSSLDRSKDFLSLSDDIFISGTDSLKYAFEESSIGKRTDMTFLQFSSVFESMVDPWHRTSTKLAQLARVSQYINETKDPNLEQLNNAKETTLETIRSLAEQGYRSKDYRATNAREEAMCSLWAHLEQGKEFEALQRFYTSDAHKSFLQKFMHALDRANIPISRRYAPQTEVKGDISEQFRMRKRIVLTGFYFVTPIQYRCVELLHQCNIDIVFFNHWDPRYPEACSVWEEFFGNPDFPLLPPKAQWNIGQELSLMGSRSHFIAQRLSGTRTVKLSSTDEMLQIASYSNTSSFLEHMAEKVQESEHHDGQYVLFVPRKEEIEEVFRDFFPDSIQLNDRHFLSYPIGSLLFYLHEMWNHNTSELQLTVDGIQECLSSGWIRFSHAGEVHNGQDILPIFRKVQDYFAECVSLQEWKSRATYLHKVITKVVDSFQPSPTVSKTETYRFHEFMSNPLRYFSFFDVTEEEILLVKQAIEEIAKLGTMLFSYKSQPVSLQQHFQNIQSILMETKARSSIHPQEQVLLEELQRRLEEVEPIGDKFLFRDLKYGVNVYLSGNIDEEKEQTKEAFQILPFAKLDELLFLGNEMEAHICMMSDDLLPRSYNFPSWPATLDGLPNGRITKQLTAQTQIAQKIDTYLIFIAGAWGKKLTFSWIEDWRGKERVQSPYISLLLSKDALEKKGGDTMKSDGFPLEHISVTDWEPPEEEPIDMVLDIPETEIDITKIPNDVIAQVSVCPRRFYYGFVASHHPYVQSEFHYSFLYGAMTRSFGFNGGQKEWQIKKMMSDIMPNFTELFKSSSFANAKHMWNKQNGRSYNLTLRGGTSSFERQEYHNSRDRLQLIGASDQIKKAKDFITNNAYEREMKQKFTMLDFVDVPDASPSENCMYCPFNNVCDKTMYPGESRE